MKAEIEKMCALRTFSGKFLNVLHPDPDAIELIDIVHGLSHQCRFGGHTPMFYSVAQHSVLVSAAEIPQELKLQAIMHDAAEAFLGDMPTPMKRLLPRYQKMEDNLMKVIAAKFGFEWPMHPIVKKMDQLVLHWEWHSMFEQEKNIPPLKPLPAAEARHLFLHHYNQIMEGK